MFLFVDTTHVLEELCRKWRHSSNARLYVDLEGRRLCRHGTIDVAQIHDDAAGTSYIVDVATLGRSAFSEVTLKGVFEDSNVTKIFFDVRNDSDALWGIYDVYLRNVEDIQLFELAARTGSRSFVSGLSKAIERDAGLTSSERQAWTRTKEAGCLLFAPELGGSYDVFAERPMSRAMLDYCVQDVVLLPRLAAKYKRNLNSTWLHRCQEEAKKRVEMCRSSVWRGEGRLCALAPAGWA